MIQRSPARVASVLCAVVTASVALTASVNRASSAATNGELIASRLPRAEFRGGAFIRHPRVVTITFAGDDPQLVARLQRFGSTIARTPWWRMVADGYCARPGDCVGEGQGGTSVVLDEVLPQDVHAVELSAIL